ncbi:MAG: hypothetical protein PHN82_05575 [bacterium]|nr:hypothetical protein [bacterium]
MKMMHAVLACCLLVVPAIADAQAFQPNILLLNEQCDPSTPYYPGALNNLGLAFTETDNGDDFLAALTDGTEWDLVLVDEYNEYIGGTALAALSDYIRNGGRCALSYWDLDPTMAGVFGAAIGDSYETPKTVHRWDAAHPIFTTPNTVPDLAPVQDPCMVDGFYLEPLDGATAVAGYTPTTMDFLAAIVIGNGGRTILLGITPGVFGPDMEKLLENCIEFLRPPAPPLRLTLSSLAPAVGGAFTVDVAVQPLAQAFDAWGVILGPNGVSYSFTLGNPAALRNGALPLATNVPGLAAPYTGQLFTIASIPAGAAGDYTIVVELVPAGIPPLLPIDGYASVKNVTVQ